MQLYGLRNCDTCRAARKALPEADFVDVRESPLDRSILETALERFGDALLNRKSTTWRGLSAGDRARPPLDLLADHPALMKRPLIVAGDRMWLGWTAATRAELGG